MLCFLEKTDVFTLFGIKLHRYPARDCINISLKQHIVMKCMLGLYRVISSAKRIAEALSRITELIPST